ncbi:HD-GYP domain-containing protein [Desulfobacterota bacterium M19]
MNNNKASAAPRKDLVMIVDDDPITRRLMALHLNTLYDVVTVASGVDALELLQNDSLPDIILLDVIMPGIDGLEVCRRLRENPRWADISVIFITILGDEFDEKKGLELGAVDYIAKPIKRDLLRLRVRNHLRLKRLQNDLHSMVAKKSAELSHSRQQIENKNLELKYLFESMSKIQASRDCYTAEHAMRVALISMHIGRRLGVSEQELRILEQGCYVHDIGKVAIPDDVLLKPGRFDKQDRQIMEYHPLIGGQIFSRHFAESRMLNIILQHHERLDGSGYPHGLEEAAIDPLARIVMVADVYEALIARRPYKQPMKRGKAIGIISNDAERGMFDDTVVDCLIQETVEWSPLSVHFDSSIPYQNVLEKFRQKTYFREPLSEFFNYRYLIFLDDRRLLVPTNSHYHLIRLDFSGLKRVNQRLGYIKTDQIIDTIGIQANMLVESCRGQKKLGESELMFFRKGAGYLIYSHIDEDILESLMDDCRWLVEKLCEKYGITPLMSLMKFAKGQQLTTALESIYN